MTWIGKILSLFVLIVGVAAMWFMATVYVARTNWKNDRDAWQALYQKADSARVAEQSAYRSEKDALERQLAAEITRTKGLNEQVAKLKGANDVIVAENKRLDDVIKKSDVLAADLGANLQALTDEAKKLRDRSVLLERERQQLVLDREVALKDRQSFENQAKQAVSDRLLAEGRVESLTTQLSELRATGGNANALVLNSFGKPPAPLPDGVRGTITAYQDGYVSLSIGIDAGLTQGAVLDVFRSEGGGRYLGTVVVERVYPKEAVATFKPADARRGVNKLRAEELPKVGDTVGKVGISGPLSLKK
jgi:hypothetical protein